jgi:hypothetical protein
MPHELRFDRLGNLFVAERDNHVIRKIDRATGIISTVAGTGAPGFSGDGGPAAKAQLRQPHSLVFDRDGTLLVCDIGNQRIRRIHLDTGIIETYAGTGDAKPTPDVASVNGTPLNGPRTFAMAANGICTSRCAKATPSCESIGPLRRFIASPERVSRATAATAARP